MVLSNTELAELRWSVRGKILDELREREIELTTEVVMALDVVLDAMVAFDEGDRLSGINAAINDWTFQDLISVLGEDAKTRTKVQE